MPGRDGGKDNFSSMIDDDLFAKRHGSLCGTNTQRSHSRECEHLSFTPMDHHKAAHTHNNTKGHAQTQKLILQFREQRDQTGKLLVDIKYMWCFRTYCM